MRHLCAAASRIAGEIQWRAAGRALFAGVPFFALSLLTGQAVWFNTALVAMSSLIAAERASLTPLGVLVHGAAIVAGFALLFFTLPFPPLFVPACAAFAAASIWLAGKGRKLRSLGNWTFLPALYLACETAEHLAPDAFLSTAIERTPLLAAGIPPVLLLTLLDELRSRDRRAAPSGLRIWRLESDADFRGRDLPVGEAMLAIACAVAMAASFVELSGVAHGQWAIWSAASVVTGDVASSRVKLRDRLTGALIGVPIGMAAGLVVPHDELTFGLATFAAMLTLVSFRHYLIGFGTRCMLIALALVIASGSPSIAAERVVNVLAGGLFGIVGVLGVHALAHRAPGRAREAI